LVTNQADPGRTRTIVIHRYPQVFVRMGLAGSAQIRRLYESA
jgi:hypothetical protein